MIMIKIMKVLSSNDVGNDRINTVSTYILYY